MTRQIGRPRPVRTRPLLRAFRGSLWALWGVVGVLGCSAQLTPEQPGPPDSAAAPKIALSARTAGTHHTVGEASARPDGPDVSAISGAESSGPGDHKETAQEPVNLAPEATPAPTYFEGRTHVTYKEFVDELRRVADALATDPDVVEAHQVLLKEKQLSEDELPLESFSRSRLAFESARDSGLWGIRGTITDQMPWSDRIWQQWDDRSFTPASPVAAPDQTVFPTAVAECDELGALFAILARDLGVVGFVGLHWPYWNHVVPVWQVDKKDGTFVRIIVPATQTFLDKKETMGTTGLKTNRHVFPYVRHDRKSETTLSADLARYLLTQSHEFGGLSTAELTQRRLWHRWNNRPGAPEQEIVKSPAPKPASVKIDRAD